jgi:hypothetical protein
MCDPGNRKPSDNAALQIAEILFRDLHLAYPVMPGDVTSLIFRRWETLKTLAHAVHEQDRRKNTRDRRA